MNETSNIENRTLNPVIKPEPQPVDHKINQMLPTVKEQRLVEAEDVLKEAFTGASLLANSLVR